MSENVSKIEEVKEELNEVTEDLVEQAEDTPQTQVAKELSTKDKIVQTIVAVRPVVKRLLIITGVVAAGGIAAKVISNHVKKSYETTEDGEVLEGDFTLPED
nr:MAG TPA: hypothetical protein [Caudoviricetes sp.]